MTRRVILLAAALLLAATPALCQARDYQGTEMGQGGIQALPPGHPPVDGRGGQTPPAGTPRHWNPETVQQLTGTISAIGPANIAARPRKPGPLVMTLDTAEGAREVVLGPAWYVTRQDPRLSVGDQVTVTGSVLTKDGEQYVIAQTVEKDGQILTLRDENGYPLWRGQGRAGRGAMPHEMQPGPMGGGGGMSGCPMGGGMQGGSGQAQ
ncbi:MAG: hypothetical protein V2A77_11330 [Pseudomonadota bacterium]